MIKTKKGIIWNEITGWIIAIAVLALVVAAIIIMKTSGINIIDKLRQLFRFG